MGETEIAYFHQGQLVLPRLVFFPLKQYVLEFHIAVDDSIRVEVVKAVKHIHSVLLQFVLVLDWSESL